MKYGIQAVRPDNSIQFCCSTRGRRGSFIDDICETALFVQEKSAVDALRVLRLEGAEADGTQLFVIEVDFKVNRLIPVERPEVKTGFVLLNKSAYNSDHAFFYGTKTSKSRDTEWSDTNMFANAQRATVFKTVKEAADRRNALVATAQNYHDYNAKNPSYNSWRTHEEAEKYRIAEMLRHAKAVDDMNALEIIPYP